ncbi:Ger(x)C family spore germination protein [Gorillibacterium sp. sgz5001074]|uniref:Ger(x)C family spore germination protein n=1 Tax=Gorillibacterium sp. sgz5001074 TaxID=3446695 RepID=UPI003F66A51A
MKGPRCVVWTAAIVLLLLLQGCSNSSSKAIDNRFFVVSLGVDGGSEGKIVVTAKLAVPKGILRDKDSEFVIFSEEDETIEGALNKIRTQVDKELNFGHLKLIVFGEEVARKGLRTHMDWMQRNPEVQKICWLAVGKPTARQTLEIKPRSERFPSNHVFLVFSRSGMESDLAVTQPLYSFYREITEVGVDSELPVLERVKQGLAITHTALFKDDKLVLELSPDETRLLNLLHSNGRLAGAEWVVRGDGGDPVADAVILSKQQKASYKILEGPEPEVKVRIQINGDLREVVPHRVMTPDTRMTIERLSEEKITQVANTLLKKCQSAGIDPVGLGLRYRARHWAGVEEEKQAWEALYPQLIFKVETQVKVKNTGNMK